MVRDLNALPNPILSAALSRPEHPALLVGDKVWSWGEMAQRARTFAGGLYEQGARPGHRVAIVGDAGEAFVFALHAIAWLGAAAVPIPQKSRAEDVLARVGREKCASVLLLDNANEGLAAALRGGAPVLVLRPGPAREERFWGLDEERLVLTTSGTSGSPQSVVLTTQQLVMSAFGSAVRLGHLPSDTWLLCLPLHHIGGLSVLFRCALYGTTVSLHERFDAGAVARALDSGETNLVSLVPRMLAKVLSAREASAFPLSVRCILLGGAPASELLLKRCSAIGAPVAQTWGMTETASQVCTSRPGQLGGLGEVGAPLTFSRVRSVDGRLEVTGPTAPGGSFLTPDVGEVSPSGGVKLLGRADDIIISGGENISPAEVERALSAHPSIADAAVVGLADERWGARPAAALVLEEGAPRPSLSELRSWCRERIDSFKAPDRCVWCEALPRRGELGKVSRQAVRDIFYEKNFEIDECVVCAQGTEEEAR